MKRYALIMAAGEGHRAGGDIPKQFVELLGIPMLWWSVRAFHQDNPDTKIRVVMHPGFFYDYDLLLKELPEDLRAIEVDLAAGGRTRGESVRNGLMSIPDDPDILVAVHDAARPMVTPKLIADAWDCAAQNGSAIPVCPVTDSLRELTPEGTKGVDRSRFVSVQTPQTFRADILHKAYRLPDRKEFTDDASRVEALGYRIATFPGNPVNIKVTNPSDFAIAAALLKS